MRLYKAQVGVVVAGVGLMLYGDGLRPKVDPASDIALGSSASDGDLADGGRVAATETPEVPSQAVPGLSGDTQANLGYAASGYVVSGYAAYTGEAGETASNAVLGVIAAGNAVPGSVAGALTALNGNPARDPMPNSLPAGVQGQALAPLLAALIHIDGDPEATLPGVRVPDSVSASGLPALATTQPDAQGTVPVGLVDTAPFPRQAALDLNDLPIPGSSDPRKTPSDRPTLTALATVSPPSETETVGAAPASRRAPAGDADGQAVSLALPALSAIQPPGAAGGAVLEVVDQVRASLPTVVDRFVAAGQEHDLQAGGPGLGSEALPDIGNHPVELLFSAPDRAGDTIAPAGPAPVAGTVGLSTDAAGAGEAAAATRPTGLAATGVPEPSTLALIGLALLALARKRSAWWPDRSGPSSTAGEKLDGPIS